MKELEGGCGGYRLIFGYKFMWKRGRLNKWYMYKIKICMKELRDI